MTDMWPRSGLSDVKELKAGMGVFGGYLQEATGSRIEGSNISATIIGTGNVSGVVLKSSCPMSQNSMRCKSVIGQL